MSTIIVASATKTNNAPNANNGIILNLIPQTELDQILNIRILSLASKMSLVFQRETLRPADITVQQWRALVSLARFGELHLRALAQHASQDPAHTSRVVKSMIAKGWVRSRADENDQRRINFELTDSGVALVEHYWPEAKQFAADVKELFSEEEFEQFKVMLERVTELCNKRLSNTPIVE